MNYLRFFGLLRDINKNGANRTKESLVSEFTNGRTDSIRGLSEKEYTDLCLQLESMLPKKKYDKADKMRKAIISQFLSIGKTAEDAKAWAEKHGVRSKKKGFNEYDNQELYLLVQNAQKVKSDHIKAVSKGLKNGLQPRK